MGRLSSAGSNGDQSTTNSVNAFFSTIAGTPDDDNLDIGIGLIALERYNLN